MNNPDEIRKLAHQRLKEAHILFENKMCDGAFYLAGYSVEMTLKAKICERIGIPNLYDESDKNVNSIKGVGEIRKFLKTHDLFTLLIFSGFKNQFDEAKAKDINLAKANSLLFNSWNEKARYKPCGHIRESDVEKLITSLLNKEEIITWIEKN